MEIYSWNCSYRMTFFSLGLQYFSLGSVWNQEALFWENYAMVYQYDSILKKSL